MPKFKLSDDDRKALVIFLKSRQGTTLAESPMEAFKLDTSTIAPVPESAAAVAATVSANLSTSARARSYCALATNCKKETMTTISALQPITEYKTFKATFHNGVSTWTHIFRNTTLAQARIDADGLCYEATTSWTITEISAGTPSEAPSR